jgi:hypothetical protein
MGTSLVEKLYGLFNCVWSFTAFELRNVFSSRFAAVKLQGNPV